MRILKPDILARLKNFNFDLRRHRVEGHLTGRHRSLKRGFSQEFAQHRPYVAGDDLKHLDWKVYARKDRFFVKEFQEEKSLKTYMLVDRSGSMGYRGAGPETKWEYARRLAMCMAYLILGQGDAAGLLTFDTERRDFLPPRRRMTHLELMDDALSDGVTGGETDLAAVLSGMVSSLPRRSLIVLVSDLLGDSARILEALRVYAARKHRLLVLQVLDPSERDLDIDGPVLFESMENSDSLRCEVSLLRESYREAFALQQRLYEASFHSTGVHHAVFYTDESWHRGLARFLARQSAVA
ncbi:MAG: DUF58 domain-containing protein [Elusimicrobia bacterium]|nr:MAG: DUF58 domain-containing protein [Elusimicrobiota bacterium]